MRISAYHLVIALLCMSGMNVNHAAETTDQWFNSVTVTGTATGGRVTLGSVSNPDILISVNTTAGQSVATVVSQLAAQPLPPDCPLGSLKVETPGILRVAEDGSMVFVRSTDGGIRGAPSPTGFNARPSHADNKVYLKWSFASGNPSLIYVWRYDVLIAKLNGTVTSYTDTIPADDDREADVTYRLTCFNMSGSTYIPSDYSEVRTTSPKIMPNDVYGIASPRVTSGVKGASFRTDLEKNAGTDPVAWSLAAGTLPAGLSLTPNGVVMGTPTAVGTQVFTVRVVDFAGQVTTREVTLTISEFPKLNQLQHAGDGDHHH